MGQRISSKATKRIIIIMVAGAIVAAIVCAGALVAFGLIRDELTPKERDLPGLTQELEKLTETGLFDSADWNGQAINKVIIQGAIYNRIDTDPKLVKAYHCPQLLALEEILVPEKYTTEVTVSTAMTSNKEGRAFDTVFVYCK